MRYPDIFLTEQDRLVVDVIRDFVEREIMPVRQQIDDDKDHVIIRRILQGLFNLGLMRASLPQEYGGAAAAGTRAGSVATCLVTEELSRGDSGITVAAGVTGWALAPAVVAGNKVVLKLVGEIFSGSELRLGCFAMTEPAAGCDIENLAAMQGRTIQTRAVLDGDEWVINGAKRFPSNAGVADIYCVVCQTEPDLGEEGIALIYVPSPWEGLSFGRFENKAGMQADRNADIYFDNVRVPRQYRAAGPGADARLMKRNLTAGRVASAAMAVGNAQAAFERVLEYTSSRVVQGRPIRQHSMCAGMLADMAIGIETARACYLQTAYTMDRPETYGEPDSDAMLSKASLAKVYACDMAITVTNKAMELMGSYGYMREFDIEKYWRDCKEIQLWLGGAQLARLDVARGYYEL
ncbi:MAG: acyl-CoA dehydrogenase family protein [Dehalococcoidia bacterium]